MLIILTCLIVFLYTRTQTFKVQKAVYGKDCNVHAAVIYKDVVWTFNNKKAPLMSVFKYFIALKVLDKIEKENPRYASAVKIQSAIENGQYIDYDDIEDPDLNIH